ncbi:reverse transcriptase domain-containing protein [Tanacetum coccineum]
MDECLALADLGASINLMPFFRVEKRFLFLELTPYLLWTLELAVVYRYSKPIGIAEDVYLKVGKFKFSVDFVVVDFDADSRVPLILERSFLKTERALINVYEAELTLRVGKEAFLVSSMWMRVASYSYYDTDVVYLFSESYSFGDRGNILLLGSFSIRNSRLTPHLEYAFLEGDNKLPVIIAKDLSVEEKSALLKGFEVNTGEPSLGTLRQSKVLT